MISKTTLLRLFGGVLLLPVAIVLLQGMSALLDAMQDAAGAAVLARLALAAGIIWGLMAFCLLLALAAHAIQADERREK